MKSSFLLGELAQGLFEYFLATFVAEATVFTSDEYCGHIDRCMDILVAKVNAFDEHP